MKLDRYCASGRSVLGFRRASRATFPSQAEGGTSRGRGTETRLSIPCTESWIAPAPLVQITGPLWIVDATGPPLRTPAREPRLDPLRPDYGPHPRLDASARASVACATGVSAESGKGDTLLTFISQSTYCKCLHQCRASVRAENHNPIVPAVDPYRRRAAAALPAPTPLRDDP